MTLRSLTAEADRESCIPVNYQYTPNLVEILQHLQSSLVISTYQAGKVLVLGTHAGKLTISFLDYDRPMGLAIGQDRIAIGAGASIHLLKSSHAAARTVHPAGSFDGCYVAHTSRHTGRILGHDLGWGHEGLWVVNTLFSCLCTLDDAHSFVPCWKPSFISQLADEDRCHLNGMALEDGAPRYVTALAETDTAAGWRGNKARTGVIMDVQSGEVLSRGLCMPHSPRVRNGELFVLNSGHGHLSKVDRRTGQLEPVEQVPGYTRGLAFCGQFAFVGLSRIRETNVFGGLPIGERRDELCCGVAVIDMLSGRTVGTFRFLSGVEEIFAVDVIQGHRNIAIGGASQDEKQQEIWIVPASAASVPSRLADTNSVKPATAGNEIAGVQSRAQAADSTPQTAVAPDPVPGAIALEDWLAAHPDDASAWITLGNFRQEQDRQADAIECYRRAVAAQPGLAAARQNLGYLLFNQGFPEESRQVFKDLLKIDASPMNRLLASSVLPVIYQSSDELSAWRQQQWTSLREMVDQQQTVDATKQLVPTAFFWPYQGHNDAEIMSLRGRIIQGRTASLSGSSRKTSSADGRLRVGFLSAYFRNHTIGRLNIGRIEKLDRSQFHVTVCSTTRTSDAFSDRFRKAADQFFAIPRNVQDAIATLDRLNLDLLVFTDVGMDALCSTLAFSRISPVQCATWGHPETTGSPAIDYFLSSELLDDAESQSHYTERLIRMPLLGTYYERPAVPEHCGRIRTKLGLSESSHLYGCPQTLFKFHPDDDAVLRQILEHDPQGVMVVIQGRVPAWTARLKSRWQRTMPDVLDRIRFVPALEHADYLRLLHECDVILDPLHFGGGNSSYEALAMGTPIVTRPSSYLRGRITSGLYQKMQFTDCIVDSVEAYVERAVRLATDGEFRQDVSSRIQQRSAVLFEDPNEVRCFEEALRKCVSSGGIDRS